MLNIFASNWRILWGHQSGSADLAAAVLSAGPAASHRCFCPSSRHRGRPTLTRMTEAHFTRPLHHPHVPFYNTVITPFLSPLKSLSLPLSHLIFSNLLRSPTPPPPPPPPPSAFLQPSVSWAFCSHTVRHVRWRTYIICPLSVFSICMLIRSKFCFFGMKSESFNLQRQTNTPDTYLLASKLSIRQTLMFLLKELELLITFLGWKMVDLHVIAYPIMVLGTILKPNEPQIHFYRWSVLEKCIICPE